MILFIASCEPLSHAENYHDMALCAGPDCTHYCVRAGLEPGATTEGLRSRKQVN